MVDTNRIRRHYSLDTNGLRKHRSAYTNKLGRHYNFSAKSLDYKHLKILEEILYLKDEGLLTKMTLNPASLAKALEKHFDMNHREAQKEAKFIYFIYTDVRPKYFEETIEKRRNNRKLPMEFI